MNQRSSGIAGIAGALALACTFQANAARGIRTDANSGNGWLTCGSAANPCSTLPAGLSFNPFGLDPNATLIPDLTKDTTGAPPGLFSTLETQQNWSTLTQAPGLEFEWLNTPAGETPDPFGSQTYAQVIFWDLGAAFNNDEPGLVESIYSPSLQLLGPNQPGSWEISFNYLPGFANFPFDTSELSASLSLNGNIYTASYSVLNDDFLDTFVFYNNQLYAPTGWVISDPTASVPEPGTFALLLVGLAGAFGMRRMRGRQSVAPLSGA